MTKRFFSLLMSCAFALGLFQGSLYGNDEYEFKGKHFIASYLDCDDKAIRDVQALKEVLVKAARASHATIIGQTDFVFEPDGLTMVILLSESHASIHTYPEHHACFVDLFTCGDKCSSEDFDQI